MENHSLIIVNDIFTENPVAVTDSLVGAPDNGRPLPRFKPIEGPISVSQPFQDLESSELFGSYVTRDDRDVEVLIEVNGWRSPNWQEGESTDDGEVFFGNCFTLRGEYVELEPEELDRIEREWKK